MAEGSTSTIVGRLEQLYKEYNKLSHLLRTHHSVSEDSIAELLAFDSLKQQNKTLKKQVNDLTNEKSKLEKSLQHHKNENTKQIDKLKSEVGQLKDDADDLKDILKRLKKELTRYHIKYGKLPPGDYVHSRKEMSGLYKFSGVSEPHDDDALLEKDKNVRNEKHTEFVVAGGNAEAAENEKLQTRLDKFQTQNPLGPEEAEMLAADARLLLEERELLMEEMQRQQQNNKQMERQHHQQVQTLKHENEEYRLKNQSLVSELGTCKEKCVHLEKKCNSLQERMQGSVSHQEHDLAVKECQRLFEELRKAYKQEAGNMRGKIHAAKSEKKNLAEKLTDTSVHLHTLRGQVSGLKGSLRKCESRMERRNRSLKALATTTRLTQKRLRSLASICSELLEDREKLLDIIMVQKKEKSELSKEVTLRCAAVGALSQKLKEERLVWSGRVAEREGAMKAARAAWKRSNRESSHLRGLLATKDDTITTLLSDYKMFGLRSMNEMRYPQQCYPGTHKLSAKLS